MSINTLQNSPYSCPADVTIVIKEGDPEWLEAYSRWLAQRNPTDDPDWKSGVFGWRDPYHKNLRK